MEMYSEPMEIESEDEKYQYDSNNYREDEDEEEEEYEQRDYEQEIDKKEKKKKKDKKEGKKKKKKKKNKKSKKKTKIKTTGPSVKFSNFHEIEMVGFMKNMINGMMARYGKVDIKLKIKEQDEASTCSELLMRLQELIDTQPFYRRAPKSPKRAPKNSEMIKENNASDSKNKSDYAVDKDMPSKADDQSVYGSFDSHGKMSRSMTPTNIRRKSRSETPAKPPKPPVGGKNDASGTVNWIKREMQRVDNDGEDTTSPELLKEEEKRVSYEMLNQQPIEVEFKGYTKPQPEIVDEEKELNNEISRRKKDSLTNHTMINSNQRIDIEEDELPEIKNSELKKMMISSGRKNSYTIDPINPLKNVNNHQKVNPLHNVKAKEFHKNFTNPEQQHNQAFYPALKENQDHEVVEDNMTTEIAVHNFRDRNFDNGFSNQNKNLATNQNSNIFASPQDSLVNSNFGNRFLNSFQKNGQQHHQQAENYEKNPEGNFQYEDETKKKLNFKLREDMNEQQHSYQQHQQNYYPENEQYQQQQNYQSENSEQYQQQQQNYHSENESNSPFYHPQQQQQHNYYPENEPIVKNETRVIKEPINMERHQEEQLQLNNTEEKIHIRSIKDKEESQEGSPLTLPGKFFKTNPLGYTAKNYSRMDPHVNNYINRSISKNSKEARKQNQKPTVIPLNPLTQTYKLPKYKYKSPLMNIQNINKFGQQQRNVKPSITSTTQKNNFSQRESQRSESAIMKISANRTKRMHGTPEVGFRRNNRDENQIFQNSTQTVSRIQRNGIPGIRNYSSSVSRVVSSNSKQKSTLSKKITLIGDTNSKTHLNSRKISFSGEDKKNSYSNLPSRGGYVRSIQNTSTSTQNGTIKLNNGGYLQNVYSVGMHQGAGNAGNSFTPQGGSFIASRYQHHNGDPSSSGGFNAGKYQSYKTTTTGYKRLVESSYAKTTSKSYQNTFKAGDNSQRSEKEQIMNDIFRKMKETQNN